MKSGFFFVEIEQWFLESGKLEEIVFFGEGFSRAVAVGTIVAGFGVVHESVVVDAVLAGVMAFVDVTVFPKSLKSHWHGAHVAEIGGAHEFFGGVGRVRPTGARQASAILATNSDSGTPAFLAAAFDIDAVFVGAGSHDDFVAAHTFVAADDIGDDGGVGVADVRQAVV